MRIVQGGAEGGDLCGSAWVPLGPTGRNWVLFAVPHPCPTCPGISASPQCRQRGMAQAAHVAASPAGKSPSQEHLWDAMHGPYLKHSQ